MRRSLVVQLDACCFTFAQRHRVGAVLSALCSSSPSVYWSRIWHRVLEIAKLGARMPGSRFEVRSRHSGCPGLAGAIGRAFRLLVIRRRPASRRPVENGPPG